MCKGAPGGARPLRRVAMGLAVAAGVLAAGLARAQTITRGPFIQNPDAPATTMTLEWWTDVAGNSTVEYGLTQALGSTAAVAQAPSCEIGAAGTCHVVPLTNLLPATRYFYQLRTNGVIVQPVSPTTYFTTLKDPADTSDLTFTVIGDWGQASSAETDVANLQDAADPQMIITVGDNAYQNGTQSDWDNNALAYYRNPMRRIPFFPTLGNHDVNNVGASNWANSVEIKLFLLPRNGTEQERYYSFDDGDAHFIVLDANDPTNSTQRAWLANDLATTTRKWKFVFLHQTPYSCASGAFSIGSNLNVRNQWGPLFEQNRVDIVFDGHDHSYERTKYLDDFDGDGLGTTYIMSGGGGATLDGAAQLDGNGNPIRQPLFGGTQQCYWLAHDCPNGPNGYCSFSTFHYLSVRLTNDTTLTSQAIDRSNNVIDTFTIVKGAVTTTTSTTITMTTSTTTTTSTTSTTVTTTSTTMAPTTTTTTTTVPTTTTTTTTSTTVPTTSTTTSTTTSSTSSTTTTATTTTTTTTTTTATTTSTTATTTTTTTTSSSSTTTSTSTTTTTSTTMPCLGPDPDGDLVCDPDDDCPTVPNPSQADADGDGLGDACDPCTGGVAVVAPRLTIIRLAPPPGDERFTFAGQMTLPVPFDPPLDPVQNGLRVLVVDSSRTPVVDATVPGGAYDPGTGQGWSVNTSGWKYRSRVGGGVVSAVLKLSSSSAGLIKFVVKGSNGSWTVSGSRIPVRGMIVLDPPNASTGECGDAGFPGPRPSCALTPSGSSLKCR